MLKLSAARRGARRGAGRRGAIATVAVATIAGAFIACRTAHTPAAPPQPSAHTLAGLAARHIVVLPTYSVRMAPGLAWSIGRPSDVARTLDADIMSAFDERGLRRAWIFPEDLEQSYKNNPTYATDPYALAEESLRTDAVMSAEDSRLVEPLASEVRTIVALHEDARYVLAPVELRLEPAGPAKGRGVLRLVLMDARLSEVQWVGEIASDTASAFGPVITASIAARLAAAVAP